MDLLLDVVKLKSINILIMKKNLFLIFAFLCAVAQGVWGQTLVKNENELA